MTALLNPAVAIPAHTAANEAAVYAIYQQLNLMIECELDCDDPSEEIRQLVRDACYQRDLAALAASDDDLDEWSSSIDQLSDQVLWDHDFAVGDLFLDAGPASGEMLSQACIAGGYSTAIPREVADSEIAPTIARLHAALA